MIPNSTPGRSVKSLQAGASLLQVNIKDTGHCLPGQPHWPWAGVVATVRVGAQLNT